ncbi:unnamed protein product, partial [Meganyctiphanes norvegica]
QHQFRGYGGREQEEVLGLVVMKVLVGLVTLVAAVAAVEPYFRMPSPYTYSCIQEKCIREEFNSPTENKQRQQQDQQKYTTLSECSLVCGQYGSMWPRPSGDVTLAPETTPFLPQNIRFTKVSASNPQVEEMLQEQAHYFQRNLHFMHPDYRQRDKEPFTEYQEEKYRKADREYKQSERRFRGDRFEDENESVARFDLFELSSKLRRQNPESQSQSNRQNFESQFRNQEQRRGREQMRYERISPFNKQQASPIAEKRSFEVEVTVTGPETQLRIDTDESYDLAVQTVGDTTTATIIASTYYGARHALESLSQLIAYNELSNSLQVIKTAKISDEPAFKYRGLMLDTGRNFYPKEEIMSLLDTMSTNKLNTFHWHISDAASFPLYSQRQPQMSYYGSYGPSKVYYPQDIREIVEYANQRGIRVIPEIDTPAHAGAGWNFGEQEGKGKLVLCNDPEDVWFNMCKEPPCGQLNPVNPEVYGVLKNLYSDILEAFNPEFVHMGGDDTSFKCWTNSPEISNYLTQQSKEVNSRELFELWNTFQTTAFAKLYESVEETGVSKQVTPMVYSSSFVKNYIDPKDYIVQLTEKVDSTEIQQYIAKGYKVVFSNTDIWSLEGPAPSWVSQASTYNRDAPRPSWKQVYENSPLDILTGLGVQNARKRSDPSQLGQQTPVDQVLGGEALVRSYETDAESIQSTVWPRGAALAERLWADPIPTPYQADRAESRMAAHRERMVNRGTRAETFQPEYCFQNQNSCYTQEEYQSRQEKNEPLTQATQA